MSDDPGQKPSATGSRRWSPGVAEDFRPPSAPGAPWTRADFEGVVGAGGVREPETSDAVDGVMPRLVVTPGSVEEVSEVMRLAARLDLAVIPRGAGTKIGWGAPPRRLDLVLETARLDHLVEHSAGDLVAVAGAGMPYDRFQRQVAGSGQMLAIDSPWPAATLGGIVATNFTGPRRHRYGTVRDSLIGITVVLPDGTVARAGGKVVKNVAGYDLGKLFTGSFGTLGVIVETIVRLHALPAERRVVSLALKNTETMGEALQAILGSALAPVAIDLVWKEGEGEFLVVFEGFGPAVRDGVERAAALLEPIGELHVGEDAGLETSTTDVSNPDIFMDVPWRNGEICLKVATVPSALPETLRAIDTLAWTKGIETRVIGQAAATVLWVALRNNGDTIAETVEALRSVVARSGGSVVIAAAPDELKPRLHIWGPTTDAFPLMRRVKDQFDPQGLMSPGRFVGGL